MPSPAARRFIRLKIIIPEFVSRFHTNPAEGSGSPSDCLCKAAQAI
jgi:hypothetical protein